MSVVPEALQQAPVDHAPAPRPPGPERGSLGLIVVSAAFIILYGRMLIATDFVPFVMDNNESFSSFWHAYNLYHFDIRTSSGLTDETFSPYAEAHAFVHTHQGNVPRLFAFLLYVLGARTIESQIGLTTLIVGTATVVLAHRLFRRLVCPLFATVACLTLITDYLYFGQWAVVTYRIWHFFFVFGTLAAACEIGGRHVRRWAGVTVALFAALFYYELVFAGFTAVFAGLFAGWRYRWQLKRLALVWAAQAAGAMTGIAVLAAQLTVHLGKDVALEDFYLTFVARNAAASDPALREYMTQFFLSHNIIFWQNIVDVRTFRTFEQFVLLLTTQHVQWYTPLVALLTAILLVGWLAGLAGDTLTGWLHRWPGLGRRVDPSQREASGPDIRRPEAAWAAVVLAVLGLGTAAVALTVLRDEAFLGLPLAGASFAARTGGLGWLLVAVSVAVAALTAWNGSFNWRHVLLPVSRISPVRLVLAAAMLFGSVLAIRGQSYFYLQSYQPVWNSVLQQAVPVSVSRISTMILLGLGVALVLAGPKRVLGAERAQRLRGIGPYLVCGVVAYTTVFLISPGYVQSGYLSRFAPLAVFILNVPLAVSIHLVLAATIHAVAAVRQRRPRTDQSERFQLATRSFRAGLLAGGLVFFVGFWLQLQVLLVGLLPPTSAAFLKMLGEPPLRGSTLFSNSYVAPMTVYTGEWGYTDTTLALWNVQATDSGYVVERGKGEYTWLRDRLTNPAYGQPDIFVCVRPISMFSVRLAVTGQANEIEGCSTIPLVAKAADGTQQYLQNQIVARDPSLMDAWAIVRLDWDHPPYLAPVGEGAARRYVDVERVEAGDQLTVRIRYEYRQQDGKAESGTRVRLEGLRADGLVCTLADQSGVHEVTLPTRVQGRARIVVEPASATKRGPRFTGDPFTLGSDPAADSCLGKPVRPG